MRNRFPTGKEIWQDYVSRYGYSFGEAHLPRTLIERELTSEGPAHDTARARRSRRTVTINTSESPLSWLHSRGHLEDRLFDAGEHLRADYERAQLGANVTMRWDPVRVNGGKAGLTATERQIAAKRRFDEAMALAGSGLTDILWRVVCGGESLAMSEKALDWPARSGKLVLKLALDRVADYYRIT